MNQKRPRGTLMETKTCGLSAVLHYALAACRNMYRRKKCVGELKWEATPQYVRTWTKKV